MKKIRITVMKKACYHDLIKKYENPIEHPCDMAVGMSFVSENAARQEGMCESAWETVQPFVSALADGGGDFYNGWMKNRRSAMLSCNDGFRPVSFLVEAIE